jgi:hypothetical protein
LRLRRRPVDLVGQTNLREDRPLLKFENPPPLGVLINHVRAENIRRHQVGRKLDAIELQVQRLRKRPHQQSLPQARHALQQAMPANEHARQHAVHDVVVPDDHAPNLLLHRRVAIAKLLRLLLHRLADTHEDSSKVRVHSSRIAMP